MKKILVDGRLLSNRNTGISRYTEKIIEGYVNDYGKNNVTVITNFNLNVTDKFYTIKTRLRPYNLLHFLFFSFFLKSLDFEILHSPFYSNSFFKLKSKKYVITVHDVMYRIVDNMFSSNSVLNKIGVGYFDFLVNRSLANSDVIISVSKTTSWDVLKFFKFKSIVIPERINTLSKKDIDVGFDTMIMDTYNVEKNSFFLYTGNLRRQKNIEFLLRCFKKAKTEKKLLIVGNYRIVPAAMRSNDNVVYTGYIKDEDLAVLYRNCSAFVFPSLYEGFGLPVLEALSLGAKVFSSKEGALSEFSCEAINFFDPKIENELIRLFEHADRFKFIEPAVARLLDQYNWAEILREMNRQVLRILNYSGLNSEIQK